MEDRRLRHHPKALAAALLCAHRRQLPLLLQITKGICASIRWILSSKRILQDVSALGIIIMPCYTVDAAEKYDLIIASKKDFMFKVTCALRLLLVAAH